MLIDVMTGLHVGFHHVLYHCELPGIINRRYQDE